jgi:hypothetical protein
MQGGTAMTAPTTIEDLAELAYDAWRREPSGDPFAGWRAAVRAVVLDVDVLLTDAYANQAAFDRWRALVDEARGVGP